MNRTKPSQRPQLALAGRGGVCKPQGPRCLQTSQAGDSLGRVPAVVTAPPVSHLPAAPCPCGDPIRCPSSASPRKSPSLGGPPPSPSVTDEGGAQAQPQPCLEAPLLLAGCGDPRTLPAGGHPPLQRAGLGHPVPSRDTHDASLTGPFPRSVPRPGLRPTPHKGTHRLAARPVSLEAARGSCPSPGGARGRGPGMPCQGGVASERFARQAFWPLPRPVGRL